MDKWEAPPMMVRGMLNCPPVVQGLSLLYFSAQCKHILWGLLGA